MKKYNEKGKEEGVTDSTKYEETLNKDRRKAEEEYAEGQQMVLNFQRILREGVNGVDDLVEYLFFTINDSKHMEDIGRVQNNSIVYSEAIGIHREFEKLLNLIMNGGTVSEKTDEDASEKAHRENNDGKEGYV